MHLVAVTSGKGGTGKSCVAAYTGAALADAGQTVLLVEAGRDARSLDWIMDAQSDIPFDLRDVLSGFCDLKQAIAPAFESERLWVLPAPVDPFYPDAEVFTAQLRQWQDQYDWILVDGVDFRVLAPELFDVVLMVTTLDNLSIRACQGLARTLFASNVQELRLVMNNVPDGPVFLRDISDFDDVIDRIGAQLVAVLPHSESLHASMNRAQRLDTASTMYRAVENLSARLRGESRRLLVR